MIVWDASKTIRRSWRQNPSVTLKGEDCGLIVGSIYELFTILQKATDGLSVILSEYDTNIDVDPERFNRYYPRTSNELVNNYIFSKIMLTELLKALNVRVYNSKDLNNFITCKCLLETIKEPTTIISEFAEFACFASDSVQVQVLDPAMNPIFFAIFGTYFFDKVYSGRKSTLTKDTPDLFTKKLTPDEFFPLIINGNLNSKQKEKILAVRDKIETNYTVLTRVGTEERNVFNLLDLQKSERNKTKFKLLNIKYGYKFADDFIDSLFAEVNRIRK